MRDIVFIAIKDLKYMLRQRPTILWTFIMPIVFFYFIGTVTGGFGGSGPGQDAIAVDASESSGFLAGEVEGRLRGLDFDVLTPADSARWSAAKRRLVLPAAMTDSALAGHQAPVTLKLTGDGISLDYDQIRVGRAVYTVLADLTVLKTRDLEPTPEAFAALKQTPRALTMRVHPAGVRREIPVGFQQTIPGTMVMFTVLVLLTSGAVLLVNERRLGLLRRLASTPISRRSIVGGKWCGRMVLGLVQITFALISGTLLFGMKWGPDFPTVILVLFVYAGMNASLGLLLGTLARTEGQATGIGVLTANVLGALGGCWWPIEVTPQWMQSLALFLPTGWAMDAMHKLVSFGAGPASVLPHILVMVAAALGFGALSVRFFRYD